MVSHVWFAKFSLYSVRAAHNEQAKSTGTVAGGLFAKILFRIIVDNAPKSCKNCWRKDVDVMRPVFTPGYGLLGFVDLTHWLCHWASKI